MSNANPYRLIGRFPCLYCKFVYMFLSVDNPDWVFLSGDFKLGCPNGLLERPYYHIESSAPGRSIYPAIERPGDLDRYLNESDIYELLDKYGWSELLKEGLITQAVIDKGEQHKVTSRVAWNEVVVSTPYAGLSS